MSIFGGRLAEIISVWTFMAFLVAMKPYHQLTYGLQTLEYPPWSDE
jgi:hypothetical protein